MRSVVPAHRSAATTCVMPGAVRAILHPQISPSLAAKSMGHSLAIHSRTYQRWFDQSSMLGVLEEL